MSIYNSSQKTFFVSNANALNKKIHYTSHFIFTIIFPSYCFFRRHSFSRNSMCQSTVNCGGHLYHKTLGLFTALFPISWFRISSIATSWVMNVMDVTLGSSLQGKKKKEIASFSRALRRHLRCEFAKKELNICAKCFWWRILVDTSADVPFIWYSLITVFFSY